MSDIHTPLFSLKHFSGRRSSEGSLFGALWSLCAFAKKLSQKYCKVKFCSDQNPSARGVKKEGIGQSDTHFKNSTFDFCLSSSRFNHRTPVSRVFSFSFLSLSLCLLPWTNEHRTHPSSSSSDTIPDAKKTKPTLEIESHPKKRKRCEINGFETLFSLSPLTDRPSIQHYFLPKSKVTFFSWWVGMTLPHTKVLPPPPLLLFSPSFQPPTSFNLPSLPFPTLFPPIQKKVQAAAKMPPSSSFPF